MSDTRKHIVIIGNGIAGVTAALHIRKYAEHQITLISDETPIPFARTALMYLYMAQVRPRDTWLYAEDVWAKNRIDRCTARVTTLDVSGRRLTTADGRSIDFDDLILATGSLPVWPDCPGRKLDGVSGLYHLQDLARVEAWTRDIRQAVIIGGGLIGIEMAEMLHSRGLDVTFVVREKSYMDFALPAEESAMVNREIRRYGIDLRLDTALAAIADNGHGHAAGILTTAGERIAGEFVGLTIGVRPNLTLVSDTGIATASGILVDEFLQTSAAHIYAIGDCAEIRNPRRGRRAIEAMWYAGRMMGQTVARTICGEPTAYAPGIWFASAKFFSIEHQIYGRIDPQLPSEQESAYWEHPDGRKSIRLQYDRASGAVVGVNLMGIRFRHEVCARWIAQGAPVRDLLQQIEEAAFDAEFTPRHHRAFRSAVEHRLVSGNTPIRL